MSKSAKKAEEVDVRVGFPAPDFNLPTENNDEWRLSEQRGKTVVLLFYPGNETLVCTRQLCSVRDNWADYLQTKATVVGISPGSVEEVKLFSANHQLPLQLLADEKRRVTKIYSRHRLFPISFTRAVVVVDAKGIVRTRSVMLRAFRPSDRQIIRSIRSAKADAMIHAF